MPLAAGNREEGGGEEGGSDRGRVGGGGSLVFIGRGRAMFG